MSKLGINHEIISALHSLVELETSNIENESNTTKCKIKIKSILGTLASKLEDCCEYQNYLENEVLKYEGKAQECEALKKEVEELKKELVEEREENLRRQKARDQELLKVHSYCSELNAKIGALNINFRGN